MPIYAMRRSFSSGKLAKRVIVYLEANNKAKAFEGFGAGRFWSGFHENTGFAAVEVDEVPAGNRVLSANELIEEDKRRGNEF